MLGEKRSTFGAFENFHFAGHFVSHQQMMDAIVAAWEKPLKIVPLPWLALQAMGLVNGLMREVVKMRYLWNNSMELVDPRLEALLGTGFHTPFEAAVATTVGATVEARQAA